MYKIIWKFVIKSNLQTEFERHYNREGSWNALFKKEKGFVQTELFRSLEEELTYVTIDTWLTQQDFIRFFQNYKKEYEELDKQLEYLTVLETKVYPPSYE